MKVLLDTNVIRRIAHNEFKSELIALFKSKIESNSIRVYFSPLSLIEIVSDLDETSSSFILTKKYLEVIHTFSLTPLTDPDNFLRIKLFKLPQLRGCLPEDSARIVNYILSINDVKVLFEKEWTRVPWSDVPLTMSDFMKTLRKEDEGFSVEMLKNILVLCNDANEGKQITDLHFRATGEMKSLLIKKINSDEFNDIVYSNLIQRLHITIFSEDITKPYITPFDIECKNALNAVRFAYKSILLKLAKSNLKPINLKNDYFDFLFCFYLVDPKITLVTNDKGIRNYFRDDVVTSSRVYDFEEFCNKLSMVN